jgi:hypothetical protein
MTPKEPSSDTHVLFERTGVRVVGLLLLFESISVFFLWVANPIGQGAEEAFALCLASDLISFAMISYVHRSLKQQNRFKRYPLIVGCCFVVILLLAGFGL